MLWVACPDFRGQYVRGLTPKVTAYPERECVAQRVICPAARPSDIRERPAPAKEVKGQLCFFSPAVAAITSLLPVGYSRMDSRPSVDLIRERAGNTWRDRSYN